MGNGGLKVERSASDAYQLLTASFYIEKNPKNIASLIFLCEKFNNGSKLHGVTTAGMRSEKINIPNHKEDDLIEISHGGGYYFLTEGFLLGKVDGEAIIWVTPHNEYISIPEGRDELYALRTPLKHCDLGAVLTAKIPMKFLHGTNNQYEFGLRAKYVPHFKEINILPIRRSEVINYAPQSILRLMPLILG